jgi:hypothetical protein
LDQVLKERGQTGYAKFKDRIRLSSDDQFDEHTSTLEPAWKIWVDTFRPELERRRWYHRFSAITATAGGFDVERDVRIDHGPLGALYPTNTTHPQKEGDTMTFLYLVPTGMNEPTQPTWGSWAGRYGPRDDAHGRAYFWANQQDEWNGTNHRENTLARWAADIQHDFRARLDWCVRPRNAANHPPSAVLNGDDSGDILMLEARPGSTLSLDASGSRDPDGDEITMEWQNYPEAGTYQGAIELSRVSGSTTSIKVPAEASAKTIHLILTVRDRGDPPLARNRRAVIEVTAAGSRSQN